VIFKSLHRLFLLLVVGFAIMGFIQVPLGEKTAFQYVDEFLKSSTAQEAREDALDRLDTVSTALKADLEARNARRSSEGAETP